MPTFRRSLALLPLVACFEPDEPAPPPRAAPQGCEDYDTHADPDYADAMSRAPTDVVFVLDMSGSTFWTDADEALGEAMVSFVDAYRSTLHRREDNGELNVGAAEGSLVGVVVFAENAQWWVPPHGENDGLAGLLQRDTADWGTPNAIPVEDDDAYNQACRDRFDSYGLPWDGWDAHPGRPDLCALGSGSNLAKASEKALKGIPYDRYRRRALVAVASGRVDRAPVTTFSSELVEYWGFGYRDEQTCWGLQASPHGLAGSHFRFHDDPDALVEGIEALAYRLAEGP